MDINKLIGKVPASVLQELPSVISTFKIDTSFRLAHFLAQVSHESLNFTKVKEVTNYSKVERIVEIFRHDVDGNHDKVISPEELEHAKKYVGKPVELANFVYANQNGNGNEASGDGHLFRGRGYIMTTGRGNYADFDKYVPEDIVKNPDLVATKFPLLSAGYFWFKNNLNKLADEGAGAVPKISKVVNGGKIGLKERIDNFNIFLPLLQ